MLFALAVLLLQPQVHPQLSINMSQFGTPAAVSSPLVPGESSSVVSAPATAKASSVNAASSPAAAPVANQPAVLTQVPAAASESSSITLPDAPNPAMSPAPAGRANPVKAIFFNVIDPKFESRRDQRMWLGLSIAQHTAAGFDAWTTRREISSGQAQELNPFLKPFAGNSSIYVATQFTPVVLDYVAHHMMYSTHPWERHVWWLPQVLGTASSFAAGAHNLTVRATPAQ